MRASRSATARRLPRTSCRRHRNAIGAWHRSCFGGKAAVPPGAMEFHASRERRPARLGWADARSKGYGDLQRLLPSVRKPQIVRSSSSLVNTRVGSDASVRTSANSFCDSSTGSPRRRTIRDAGRSRARRCAADRAGGGRRPGAERLDPRPQLRVAQRLADYMGCCAYRGKGRVRRGKLPHRQRARRRAPAGACCGRRRRKPGVSRARG